MASAAPPSAPRSSSLLRAWSTCWVRSLKPYTHTHTQSCTHTTHKLGLLKNPVCGLTPSEGHMDGEDKIKTRSDVMAYLCLDWQGPAALLCFSALNELLVANTSLESGSKRAMKHDFCFVFVWILCSCFFLCQVWWKCIVSPGVWSSASRQQLCAPRSCSSFWRTSAVCGTTSWASCRWPSSR